MRVVEPERQVTCVGKLDREPLQPLVDLAGGGHAIEQQEVAPVERRVGGAADDEVIALVFDQGAGALEQSEVRSKAE